MPHSRRNFQSKRDFNEFYLSMNIICRFMINVRRNGMKEICGGKGCGYKLILCFATPTKFM